MEIIEIKQSLGNLLSASLFILLFLFFILRSDYFRLSSLVNPYSIRWQEVMGIFLIYLSLAFLILPAINGGIFYIAFGETRISNHWLGWAQISSLFIIFLSLLTYCFSIRSGLRRYIFWGHHKPSSKRFFRSIGLGFLSFLISYPFVLWIGFFTGLISFWIWGEVAVEQVAVNQIKMTQGYPVMFICMVFFVVGLVPFMEELLFRGFLQTLLKLYIGRTWSLILTALIFALVHFSLSQGLGNFQLIASLFILSLFLGFIYEKEQTLWAPIALHATFNGFSLILLTFSK
ncbi:MAG: type II CAAX endopeptidase family protein [Chlamydiales bacterium]